MDVHFYGRLGELIGREVEIDVPPGATLAQLRGRLASQFPQAAESLSRPSLKACIDDEMVDEAAVIPAGAVVEFFPPLSGG